MPEYLSIDIETYSPVDLKASGVYKYAEHPDFTILLFAYAFNDEPVKCVPPNELPADVRRALHDPAVTKRAFNALFERVCINAYYESFYGSPLPIEQWECTMIAAARMGLPLSLEQVAKVLNLPQQKDSEGRALIRYFSMPCKHTKTNGMRTRNLPEHDPVKWQKFTNYCAQDVEVERAISKKIEPFQHYTTDKERALYILDQQINSRGVLVDLQLIYNAIAIDAAYKDTLYSESAEITSLENPNSVAQLKAWLSEETGEDVNSLTKEAILDLLKTTEGEEVKRVLRIRQEMAKTSVKKYSAMVDAVGADARIRGLLQFYGANRTGRWAGRMVQVQNLPQNHLNDLDLARECVLDIDSNMLGILFGNVPDALSQLIRTAFIPAPGNIFLVSDFSAIEARVIAWLAGEKWRLDVFATHGKIYEASAAQMFRVPIESVTKGSALRQKGKISELALGYGGGVGALDKMGAAKMGLCPEELQPLVTAWRSANPAIVRLWKTVELAALKAVNEGGKVHIDRGVSFLCTNGILFITLPSGRSLCYARPKIVDGKFGDALTYEGMNQTTKQWERVDTYGGKLVENIVQAIARDCLAESMLRLDEYGYDIVMHVHDEVIIEAYNYMAEEQLTAVCEIMSRPIDWAPGLLLRADGYVTPYYRKD